MSEKKINFIEASHLALEHALEADPSVVLLGEDVADPEGGGVIGITKGFSSKYGNRVRSTPISEQAIIGASIGAAIAGMRPVAEIMLMNFTAVCMDQICNHAAKLRFMSGGQTAVPMTIRTMTGVGLGTGGQHSDMLEAWFAHTAGIKVVAASSPADAYGLLLSCIFDDDPCIFIENMYTYGNSGPAPEKGARVPLGKAKLLREGSDVTVVAYGRAMAEVLPVAEALGKAGISAEVIDLRTISPLDERAVLDSVAKTKRAVVVHEACKSFGVGAEISARINEELFGQLKAPVQRVASKNCAVPAARVLETAFMFSRDEVEKAIRATLG